MNTPTAGENTASLTDGRVHVNPNQEDSDAHDKTPVVDPKEVGTAALTNPTNEAGTVKPVDPTNVEAKSLTVSPNGHSRESPLDKNTLILTYRVRSYTPANFAG